MVCGIMCTAAVAHLILLTTFHLQVLLPRFGIEADWNYDPEDDWKSDSRGKELMQYPDFFDALFELADMW